MPEKGSNSFPLYISRPNSWFTRRFPIVAASVFLGMLLIWSIDCSTIRNGVKVWRNRRDYLALKLRTPVNLTHIHGENLTHIHKENQTHIHKENQTHNSSPEALITSTLSSSQSLLNSTLNSSQHSSNYSSSGNSTQVVHEPHKTLNLSWVSVNLEPNFTSNLLSRWLAPGGQPCGDSRTSEIVIQGLDNQTSPLQLPTGDLHEFVIQALDDNNNPRCLGGDYFETDLSGQSWKSRPPIQDLDNGSYSLKLQIHPNFSGHYNLTIILLFRHFEGLKLSPERFVYKKQLRQIKLEFFNNKPNSSQLPDLRICKKSDFSKQAWSGRWTRLAKNDRCEIDRDGRYRCLSPNFPCKMPWCVGSLSSLESNGWVYSAHCAFHLFSGDSAWQCLQNRWIFFWGDSNHVDSIRNLLNFVLGRPEINSVPRRFDINFTNPVNPTQSVRITSIFNGHSNQTLNYEGLDSLKNKDFRELIKKYFSEKTVPDTVVMNSGLHDGVHWRTVRAFAGGAEYAARFWSEVVESVKERGLRPPEILYRTTVATGGYARSLAFNPHKMEVFNGVVLDQLKRVGLLSRSIDGFDMTFPWHFDNRCNDGVHYGRAPAKARWRDGQIGHQYFVDLMLVHVLLNALCAT